MTPHPTTAELIAKECDDLKAFLIAKNEAYGDSAMKPVGIFSKLPPGAQLDVRIDDKLSRIANGHEFPGDDTILDLLGYLMLKRIQNRLAQ